MTDKKANIQALGFGRRNLTGKKRFKCIACEIFYRELCLLAAKCEHIVDVEFLQKALHDIGTEKMRQTIQEAINAVDTRDYDAILLAYGRCNDGVAGLKAPVGAGGQEPARGVNLVIPRVHDCISLFFGSRENYEEYFTRNPGTYFRTTGWTERESVDSEREEESVMHQLGLHHSYDEYVAKYGRENADYIMESMGSWQENYKYFVYIDMGLPLDDEYALLTEREAAERGLEFRRIQGNMRFLEALILGNWPESDFLIVRPGQEVVSDDEGGIISVVSSQDQAG